MIRRWIIVLGILSIVTLSTSLVCFECSCLLSHCPCKNLSKRDDDTHCMIASRDLLTSALVSFTRANGSSIALNVEDSSYLLVTESIVYEKKFKDWHTRLSEMTYVCDWDYCNDPTLIVSLLTMVKVTVDKAWFTANIYGTDALVRCHHCPRDICDNSTHSIDFDQCSIHWCLKSKTCALHSFTKNILTEEQCVRSGCTSGVRIDDSNEEEEEKNRVVVKILVHLVSKYSHFRIWGVDVFCGARTCSRSTIFYEVKQRLVIQIGNLTAFPSTTSMAVSHVTTSTADHLKCYRCSARNSSSRCTPVEEREMNNNHCVIVYREAMVTLGHVPSSSTQVHIREFPYILIQQSIVYNASLNDWITSTDFVSYGCHRHFCNELHLASSLSNIIYLSLNQIWLNTNVLDSDLPVRDCNQCQNHSLCTTSGSFDRDQCPTGKCHGTCLLSNLYHHAINHQQCYQSHCVSTDTAQPTAINPLPVILQGILYLNRIPLAVELWEVRIPCHAPDCARSEIFREVNDQLIVRVGDLSAFDSVHTTTTTSPSYGSTATPSAYDRHSCNSSLLVPSLNGSCVSIVDANNEAVDYLLDEKNAGNTTAVAHALTVYFGATASLSVSEQEQQRNKTLTPDLIDALVGVLNTTTTGNSSASFIMCRTTGERDAAFGVSFYSGLGGQIILNSTKSDLLNSSFTAAAVISPEAMIDARITYLNMLVIDKPPIEYRPLNTSDRTILSSSIIVVKTQQRTKSSVDKMNITLYLTVLPELEDQLVHGHYYCSFYDAITSSWNEFGCTSPVYNSRFHRYECSCNHLTSFALVWRPSNTRIAPIRSFDAEDIASLLFQLISILCFLTVLVHSLMRRRLHWQMHMEARDLLPLISCASTTVLYIFYITLVLTVHTQTESPEQTRCFPGAAVLMFLVYFLLILMFCIKTSVGYFNYLRFVRPLSPPSLKRLRTLLLTSLCISIAYTAFAIGFNTNRSLSITRLYPYQTCWFTPTVVHYFLSIPIGIFLLLNTTMIVLVARCLIHHARNIISSNQLSKRAKMCVIVLLSSCITQGAGWLMGPVLSVVDANHVRIFSWLFIIFNGLEGLWSIVLYIVIIRMQHVDEHTRSMTSDTFTKLSSLSSDLQKRRL